MSEEFFAGLPEHLQGWAGDPSKRPLSKTEHQQLLDEIKRLNEVIARSNARTDELLAWIKRWSDIPFSRDIVDSLPNKE